MYYHIGQCLGPCINKNLSDENKQMVNDIIHFMNGDDNHKIRNSIVEKMKKSAVELNFEKAQEYKEIISAIDHIHEKQSIALKDRTNMDVIATSSREGYFSMSILT